ncbi:glycosyltransferase family 4 protein [Salinarimonas soli]|nr:glycosyltransferase family 4 protein [Salinarimonas soli]
MDAQPIDGRRMKLLLCCEFYHPSRGGVQEVMRQLAERFAAAGHDVTVATTFLPERGFEELNGVKIASFHISGNLVRGLEGEIQRYRDFLRAFDGDAILMKAAQQWTFDASWPALDDIKCRKVFIPCGYSALYEPSYAGYFKELPSIIGKFDELIFYAEDYRDVNFAREHGLEKLAFLPNGASEKEFDVPPASGIRARLGIPDDALLLITVGTPISMKGHLEVAEAFARLDPRGRPLALALNGQWGARPADAPEPPRPADPIAPDDTPTESEPPPVKEPARPERQRGISAIVGRAVLTLRRGGVGTFLRRACLWVYHRTIWLLLMPYYPVRRLVRDLAFQARLALHRAVSPNSPPPQPPPRLRTIDDAIADARRDPLKMVVQTELPRNEVVELFFAADLFVFASRVEYSPLVLFEASASGLPFLSVPAGNAAEIARWSGGGVICSAEKDERGYVKVDPAILATEIDRLLQDDALRASLGEEGRRAWREHFTWDVISRRYLAILAGTMPAEEHGPRRSEIR